MTDELIVPMTSLPTPESARLPEDVALTISRCRVSAKIADEDSQPVYAENFAEAADTIEQQAAEIARLTRYVEAAAIDIPRVQRWANERAEAAEARIVELTRERDEAVAYRDDNEKRWHAELNSHAVTRSMYVAAKDERDEARVQVTALLKAKGDLP